MGQSVEGSGDRDQESTSLAQTGLVTLRGCSGLKAVTAVWNSRIEASFVAQRSVSVRVRLDVSVHVDVHVHVDGAASAVRSLQLALQTRRPEHPHTVRPSYVTGALPF